MTTAVLTIHGVLTTLIKILIGVPTNEGILGIVVHWNTGAILQMVHTWSESSQNKL